MSESFKRWCDRMEIIAKMIDVIRENLGVDCVDAMKMWLKSKVERKILNDDLLSVLDTILSREILESLDIDNREVSLPALIFVQGLEFFKDLSGMSDVEFYDYFIAHDWDIFRDDDAIEGSMSDNTEEIVDSYGMYLSAEQRAEIMGRYYEKCKKRDLELDKP